MKNIQRAAFLAAFVISITVLAGIASAEAAAPETTGYAVREEMQDAAPEQTAEREENYGYHVLADFTAETLDGGTFTPEDLKGYDLTIVYFWSGTCGYCVEELPELAELKKDLPSNVQLITWCPDGGVYHDTVVKMLDRRGLDVVTIISGEDDIDLLIKNLLYTPMTLFLDKDGYMLCEPLIGSQEDTVTVYNEIIDEVLEKMGVERAE